MHRSMNLILTLFLIPPLAIPFLVICFLIKTTSRGSILHWSTRVGRDNKTFKMPKFRTMRLNTPNVATHLLTNADQFITPIGKFLRKTSLDEIPQLWSVVEGNMVFVGPRPALFNQDDLITLRMEKGIHKLTPGITGWAQVKGRDELPIPEKIEMDFYYLKNRSFMLDCVIILKTIVTVLRFKGVSH